MNKNKLYTYINVSLVAPIVLFLPAIEFLSNLTGHSIFFDNVKNTTFLGIPLQITSVIFMILGGIYAVSLPNGLVAIIIDIWTDRTTKERIILFSILALEITIIFLFFIKIAFFPIWFILHLLTRDLFSH